MKDKLKQLFGSFSQRTELEKLLLALLLTACILSSAYVLPFLLNIIFKMLCLALLILAIFASYKWINKLPEVTYDIAKLDYCLKDIVKRLDKRSTSQFAFKTWKEHKTNKDKTAKLIETVVVSNIPIDELNYNQLVEFVNIYLKEFFEKHGMTMSNASAFYCHSIVSFEESGVTYLFLRFILAINNDVARLFESEFTSYKEETVRTEIEDDEFSD